MSYHLPSFSFPFFERNIAGDNFYHISNNLEWGVLGKNNIAVAQDHPILTTAILFVAKIFSQAKFYLEDPSGKKIYDHRVLDLLKNPNFFQTQNDFLETLMFTMIANGVAIVYRKKITGMKEKTLYLLDPNLIEYPEGFKTGLSSRNETNKIAKTKILYDRHGEHLKIKLGDLLYLYDLPNGLKTKNMFLNKSRIDGLKQTLLNTTDSLLAKNIILKSNGKELITGGSQTDLQLSPEEKDDMEKLFNANYGLAAGKKRGLITKAKLTWQSMHIALRDLGLDESVKTDGNIIFTSLHIPKDILSLEAKKTTYNNFKESMVSYIQNEMQSTVDGVVAVFQKMIEEKGLVLKGTFEHLPIMQFILIEKYEGIEQRALALQALRLSGLPDEVCLELCGFEKGTKLAEIIKPTANENTGKGRKRKKRRNEASEGNEQNED